MSDKTRKTRHISFDADENKILEAKAEAAGMSVSAYIRRQALEGTVQSINWELLQTHTAVLDRILEALESYIAKHSNRWLFEPDVVFIQKHITELKESETTLIQEICKTHQSAG